MLKGKLRVLEPDDFPAPQGRVDQRAPGVSRGSGYGAAFCYQIGTLLPDRHSATRSAPCYPIYYIPPTPHITHTHLPKLDVTSCDSNIHVSVTLCYNSSITKKKRNHLFSYISHHPSPQITPPVHFIVPLSARLVPCPCPLSARLVPHKEIWSPPQFHYVALSGH